MEILSLYCRRQLQVFPDAPERIEGSDNPADRRWYIRWILVRSWTLTATGERILQLSSLFPVSTDAEFSLAILILACRNDSVSSTVSMTSQRACTAGEWALRMLTSHVPSLNDFVPNRLHE